MAKRRKSSASFTMFFFCIALLSCILYQGEEISSPNLSVAEEFSDSPYWQDPLIKVRIRKASNQNAIQLEVLGGYQIIGSSKGGL